MTQKQILDNGLTIVTDALPHVRSVAVGVWLRQGSCHEPSEKAGIAHFMEHMVFKGTARRSQTQIAQELDSLGGQSDAFTAQEYAGFHTQVLDEQLPLALDLLADIVQAPAFDPEEMERERTVISEEIRMVEDSPEELAHELFMESIWAGHPLGRPIAGSLSSVAAMTRRDLQDYFAGTYVPRNLVVAAAGSVQHDDFVKLVMQHFERVGRPVDEPATLAPPRIQPVSHRREKDLEQTQLVLGSEAPSIDDVDRFPAYVLDAVLGGNLSSRLFQVIREERGLAYSVYSSLACFREVGCFSIYAGTSPENLNEVLDCVLAELERIKQTPVPDEEIARAKDHLRGSILMGTEGSASKMAQIARQEIYYGREVPDPEIIEAIDRVTASDLKRLANEWFKAPLSVTVVGRLDGLKPFPEKWVA